VLDIFATAHTWRGGDGPYSLAPMVGLILTLILIRSILRLPVGIPALVASVALGTLFSTAADTWGLTVTFSVWILGALIVSGPLGRARGASGGTPRD
jgi:hypothetical protein